MKINLSLRNRLVIWYSLIVAISLAAFGTYVYFSLSNKLTLNANNSLSELCNSIDKLIQKRNNTNTLEQIAADSLDSNYTIDTNFANILIQDTASKKVDEDLISVIYEHIIMNSKNYFIQIADTNNNIIWRSFNLDDKLLPLIPTFDQINSIDKDSLDYVNSKMIRTPELFFIEGLEGVVGDSVMFQSEFLMHEANFMIKRTKNAVITVGYSTEVIEQQTSFIINILLVTIPIILIISGFGGFFLATISMRPLNIIIKTVNDIRVTNLSRRLPPIEGDDEIARLTVTLNEMIARLERSFSQIKQFTSDASHELKTPLTVMRGELEIALSKRMKNSEYMRVIASSLDEVIRLTNVVENLLELSRADAGNIKLNFEEKSLTRLLVDIIEDAYILAEQNQIVVNSHVDPDIVFEFDQVKLHQAFLNVIDNAIKYTPKYGTIYIELKRKGNYARIIIADSGIGIPKDKLDHVFDRFYRVDKSRSSEIKGTGLGLSIVNWIIKAHEGEIDVSSEVNQGTEFSIKFPLNRISPGDPYIPFNR